MDLISGSTLSKLYASQGAAEDVKIDVFATEKRIANSLGFFYFIFFAKVLNWLCEGSRQVSDRSGISRSYMLGLCRLD